MSERSRVRAGCIRRASDPADPVLRLVPSKPEQFLRHPDGFTAGQVDAGVARVACDEHFSVAKHLVIEAEGDLAQLGEVGDQGQLVVEEGRSAVAEERLDDDEAAPPALHLPVGVARGAQPLHASDFEVEEVGGVVYVSLGVDLGVADPDFGLVDYLPSKAGLRLSPKAFIPSLASSVAKSRANWSASYSRPLTRSTSRARLAADFACLTASGPLAEISAASSLAAFNASPGPTTRLTRPISLASSAPMRRPVKMSSFASAGPIRRGSRWVPPMPGSIPRPTSGKPKLAFSAAIRTSQASATSHPPPSA